MRTTILVILNMVYIFLLIAVMLFVDLKPSDGWVYWFGIFLVDLCIADIAKYLTRVFKAKA